jgi:F-type H+-transporting ATPase subunit b
MLIDWFTVGAQIVNFLILVWLLKHFLYKPILDAIDAREKRIAAELADADTKKAEAEKERTDFEDKNKVFDLNSGAPCSAKPRTKRRPSASASSIKPKRMRKACAQPKRMRCAEIKFAWQVKSPFWPKTRSLQSRERHSRISPPSALKSGSERYSHAACGNWIRKAKELLGAALKDSSQPALVRSAFDLPTDQRAAIQNALNESFSAVVRIKFEDSQEVICGIELTVNGQKVAWSISSYLAELSKKVSDLVDVRSPATIKPPQKPDTPKAPEPEPAALVGAK